MPIPITCPACGAKANAPDNAAGKKVKCPKCQGIVGVPKPHIEEVDQLEEEPVAPPPRPAAKGGMLVPKKPEPLPEDEEDFEDEPRDEEEEFDDDEEEAPRKKGKGGREAAPPNKTILGLVAIFFPYLGIHKFMLGHTKAGLIMLGSSLLCIGLPIMAQIGFVEGIIYLAKSEEDFYETYVVKKREWL